MTLPKPLLSHNVAAVPDDFEGPLRQLFSTSYFRVRLQIILCFISDMAVALGQICCVLSLPFHWNRRKCNTEMFSRTFQNQGSPFYPE